jgi:hypothetical protein
MKTSGTAWQYASHEQPVYAVGDVHGDLDAFVRILRDMQCTCLRHTAANLGDAL